jgi:hypothetical protein
MISHDSTNDSSLICNKTDHQCSAIPSYRPLQQLYKTVYSPMYGNNSTRIKFACIYRPSERYKTTNMTYGSFYYNNWTFIQKNRPVNYDKQRSVRCYDKKKKRYET